MIIISQQTLDRMTRNPNGQDEKVPSLIQECPTKPTREEFLSNPATYRLDREQ